MAQEEDTLSAPCLLAIARFEGPRKQAEQFQERLISTLETRGGFGELGGVVCRSKKQLGVSSPAQRICQEEGVGALLFGGVDGEEIEAHMVFSTGRRLTHIDKWSRDITSILKRDPIEPAPARTKLQANDEEALIRGLVEYLSASLAQAVAAKNGTPKGDFQPQLPTFVDELMAIICLRQAEVLQITQGDDAALAWIEQGLERIKSPRLFHASFRILCGAWPDEVFSPGSEINERAVRLLEEAVAFADDPERPQALYNLLQILPDGEDLEVLKEQFQILDELGQDSTYRHAWWIERMRGSLHYRIATRQRAFAGDNSAHEEFSKAARSYSKALRLRNRSRVEEPDLGPAAPARIPRSPVLQANAYDAHHFAGNRLRAAWHHLRAQRAVKRLFKYGVRAMVGADFVTARRMFELQLAVGWSDPLAARASVMATFVSEQLGDDVEAERYWQRALEIDEVAARTAAMGMGMVREGTHIRRKGKRKDDE